METYVQDGLLFFVKTLELLTSLFFPNLLLLHGLDLFQLFDNLLPLQFNLARDLLIILLRHVNAVLLPGGQQIATQPLNLLRILLQLEEREMKYQINRKIKETCRVLNCRPTRASTRYDEFSEPVR